MTDSSSWDPQQWQWPAPLLWSLKWRQQLTPAHIYPGGHVGSALPPESTHIKWSSYDSPAPLLMHPCQWHLVSLAGPGFFLHPLLWHTTQPSQAISMQSIPVLSPGLTSKAQASAPSCYPYQQWASQAGELWAAALTISASLSPLCSQQTGSCTFIQGPEAPHLSFLISPWVKGLFRVWKCFFFHSFFPGMACSVLISFSLSLFLLPFVLSSNRRFSCPLGGLSSSASIQ